MPDNPENWFCDGFKVYQIFSNQGPNVLVTLIYQMLGGVEGKVELEAIKRRINAVPKVKEAVNRQFGNVGLFVETSAAFLKRSRMIIKSRGHIEMTGVLKQKIMKSAGSS